HNVSTATTPVSLAIVRASGAALRLAFFASPASDRARLTVVCSAPGSSEVVENANPHRVFRHPHPHGGERGLAGAQVASAGRLHLAGARSSRRRGGDRASP